MSLETINSVDINFSNGAGGHTATVNSTVDVKNSDGSPSLGVVDGEIGSKNYFSKDEINNIMSRFICTSLTKNQGPIGLTVSRKYSDITSLTLNSYLVMVRGVNAPPDNSDSFEGMFPFFSEVKGSPLKSYPSTSVREIEGKRILVVGRIYNYESATVLNGLKVSLVYNNQELKKNLCLNQDTVTQPYKDSPSLVNYTLKFGYTLNEYLEMLDYVGIVHKGLENVENGDTILFENSGTLADVTAAIAAYFGYYYFIDPNTGHLNFIDSRIASDIEITDFTQTTDENIVSATFTEDKFTPEIVNAYVGSADKPNIGGEQGRFKFGNEDDYRTNMSMFQIRGEDLIRSNKARVLNTDVISIFYTFFALNLDKNRGLFNKYVFALMLANFPFRDPFRRLFPDGLTFGNLFPQKFLNFTRKRLFKDSKIITGEDVTFAIFGGFANKELIIVGNSDTARATLQQGNGDNIGKFRKQALIEKDKQVKLPRGFDKNLGLAKAAIYPLTADDDADIEYPDQTDLFNYLIGYFKFAGSVYVSSGMTQNRADQIEPVETKGLELHGPFHRNRTFGQIMQDDPNLKDFIQWLINIKGYDENSQVKDLVGPAVFNPVAARDVAPFHFIGVRAWANPFNIPIQQANRRQDFIDQTTELFTKADEISEIRDIGEGQGICFLESIKAGIQGNDIFGLVAKLASSSRKVYNRALKDARADVRQQITLKCTLRDKRIEALDDQQQEDEERNKQLVGDPVDNEKLKELLQRYDLKSFKFDVPKTDQYTPLSLVVANGSTIEVNALREATQKSYLDNPPKNLKSSSKTIYGLDIPSEFKITTSSFQIRVGSDGITTTIGESTLKLIPPTQEFIVNQSMETIGTPSINPRLRSTQRNYLGL